MVMIRFLIVLFAVAYVVPSSLAHGFTEDDIQQVFNKLDEDADGKVTRAEYDSQKILAIYRNVPMDNDSLTSGDVSFDQTKLSREFFDSSDSDHDGKLSPIELEKTFQFEKVVAEGQNHLTREDLRAFMTRIGR